MQNHVEMPRSDWQACEGSQQVRTREVLHAAGSTGDPCEGVMVETRGCGKETVKRVAMCSIQVESG